MTVAKRIPRKLKKYLKKYKAYRDGYSVWHCIVCQLRWSNSGYDLLFCEECNHVVGIYPDYTFLQCTRYKHKIHFYEGRELAHEVNMNKLRYKYSLLE